jgi:hypothetical protein
LYYKLGRKGDKQEKERVKERREKKTMEEGGKETGCATSRLSA